MINFSIGLLAGIILTFISVKLFSFFVNRNLKNKYNVVFDEIIDLIESKSVRFIQRVNHLVTFRVTLKELGVIDIVLFMDRKDIALIKNEQCICTSSMVNKDILEKTFEKFEVEYEKDINDYVNIMGNLIDRKTLNKGSVIKTWDGPIKDNSTPEPEKTIDEILDKINEFGIGSITKNELDILNGDK